MHGLNAPEHEENDHNKENQPQAAGGSIPPTPAMRPPWQGATKRQQQNYDQYCSKHVGSYCCLLVRAQPLPRMCPLDSYIEISIAMPTLGYLRLYR
jgi:hypothetical protein